MQEEKSGCGCGEKWKMNVSYAGADPLTARSRASRNARKSDTGADAGVAENSLNDPVPTAVPLIHIV
jgi:hypothetical protein